MGGGYSSDGTSALAVSSADWWHDRIRRIQKFAVDEFDDICSLIQSKGHTLPDSVSLSLRLDAAQKPVIFFEGMDLQISLGDSF